FRSCELQFDRDERALGGRLFNETKGAICKLTGWEACLPRQPRWLSSGRALICAAADGLIVWMRGDLERVLFDEPAIHRRLDDIAAQISNDYRERDLTVIAVLHGSLMFVADLLRRIPLPLKLDCLSVASYHGKAQSSGDVVFKQVTLPDVGGRDILILDDILDSGFTLGAVREILETAGPHSF